MDPKEIAESRALHRQGLPLRAIARTLGRDPKTVRHALGLSPKEKTPSKLLPFLPLLRDLAQKDLNAPRILREIRARGYTGGLSILKDHLQALRGPRAKSRKVYTRFETQPAQEGQMDWSPYRLPIGGHPTVAHCFSLVLGFSRRIWIGFFRNEKLPTLLHAHGEAFAYHGGCPHRLVYDNQTTVTLGRVNRKPLWHPAFLEFSKYYGFDPFACKVGDAPRKGKVERPFGWIFDDFLKARAFASWDDLNRQARDWLDSVANVRVHSTTKRRVDEMYAEEKPLLIALPSTPFPSERREVRKVQKDGYLPLDGSFYPVPARLVGQYVTLRVYPTCVEVLDAAGAVAATHPVPDRPCRLPPGGGPPPRGTARPLPLPALEAAFLARFPGAAAFLEGLKRRLYGLTPLHLRRIEGLVELYGGARVLRAIERATAFRNFNAFALGRILEADHPDIVPEPPAVPLTAGPEILGALDDMEPATPDSYTLDSLPPTHGGDHDDDDRPF
jgi:transposase